MIRFILIVAWLFIDGKWNLIFIKTKVTLLFFLCGKNYHFAHKWILGKLKEFLYSVLFFKYAFEQNNISHWIKKLVSLKPLFVSALVIKFISNIKLIICSVINMKTKFNYTRFLIMSKKILPFLKYLLGKSPIKITWK